MSKPTGSDSEMASSQSESVTSKISKTRSALLTIAGKMESGKCVPIRSGSIRVFADCLLDFRSSLLPPLPPIKKILFMREIRVAHLHLKFPNLEFLIARPGCSWRSFAPICSTRSFSPFASIRVFRGLLRLRSFSASCLMFITSVSIRVHSRHSRAQPFLPFPSFPNAIFDHHRALIYHPRVEQSTEVERILCQDAEDEKTKTKNWAPRREAPR